MTPRRASVVLIYGSLPVGLYRSVLRLRALLIPDRAHGTSRLPPAPWSGLDDGTHARHGSPSFESTESALSALDQVLGPAVAASRSQTERASCLRKHRAPHRVRSRQRRPLSARTWTACFEVGCAKVPASLDQARARRPVVKATAPEPLVGGQDHALMCQLLEPAFFVSNLVERESVARNAAINPASQIVAFEARLPRGPWSCGDVEVPAKRSENRVNVFASERAGFLIAQNVIVVSSDHEPREAFNIVLGCEFFIYPTIASGDHFPGAFGSRAFPETLRLQNKGVNARLDSLGLSMASAKSTGGQFQKAARGRQLGGRPFPQFFLPSM